MVDRFKLALTAFLEKIRSRREIRKNIKELGDFYVSVIPKIGKTKAKAQIKKDLAGVTATVNADIKVDGKKIQIATKKATEQAQEVANKNAVQVSANVDLKKSKLINDIKVFGKENSKMLNDMQMSSKYSTLLNNAKLATSNKEIKNLRLQLSALKSELKATGMSGLSFGDSLKKTFKRVGEYFISTGGMFLLTQQTRQAWQEALELDKAYTDLIKVQDELTRGDYPEYLERCNEKAQELATTQKAIIEGVTEFSRSGYNLTESNQLAEQANILANVGDMTASDSSKAIISGVQAYEEVHGYTDTIDKAIALIDSYNAIGNTASITSAELAEGVQAVGAVFADSNTSVDEFIALLAAGNRQFQNADTLALGLRTAALRLRSCTTELALLGEETEGVYESTSKLQEKIEGLTNINGNGGVKILEDDGETFRSIYDIFLDISKVYKDMSDIDQSALLSLIAGTHRASAISATLNNMSEAQEIYERSLASAGSAQEEYNKYLESSEASLNRFKASMTETYQSVISGETVTGILNCANATLQFVNGLGLVESSLKGIIAIKIVKAVTMMSASLKASAIQASKFGTALKTVNNMSSMTKGTKEYADALQTLKTSCTGLTEKQLKQVLSNKSLDNSTRIAILRTNGLSKAQAQARLNQMKLTKSTKAQTTAQNTATASTFSLSAAVKGFAASAKAAFMSNPIGIGIMAISTIVGVASSKISEYNEKIKETRQANMDAAESAKEKADSLKNIYIQYEKLNSATDKTVTEEEDYKQVVLEITKALGGRADVLSNLKVGTDEYTEALKEATKAELENQYVTAKVGAKAAEDALKDVTYDAWDGSQISIPLNVNATEIEENVAALNMIRDILAEYESVGSMVSSHGAGMYNEIEWEPVNWDTNRSDMNTVVEYYNSLLEARTKLVTADNADFLMKSDIYEGINSTINLLSESVEKYTEQQYNALRLNYEWQNGIPRTEEEFRKMEQSILNASGAGESFKEILKGYLAEDYGELLAENVDVSGAVKNNEDVLTVLTDKHIEKINEYQERLSALYEALNMIRSGTATPSDIDALIDKFPELSDDTGDLETAINSLINNALVAMSDIYGDAIDNVAEFATRQEALTHFVSTTASAIDKITSSYESLNNAIKEYNENGYVSLNTLEQIIKLEPKYLSALMDEKGNIVSNTYAYRDLILMKLRDYELEALKEANLTNDQLKVDYEKGSISKVEYDAGLKASDSDLMSKLKFIDSARNNIDKLMDELMSGDKSKDSTASFSQEIDWAAQSISALENEVSRLESVLDNTESWEAQRGYIEELRVALEALSKGYSDAWEFYKGKYNETLTSGILAERDLTEELRKKIESGEVFDIQEFIDENVASGEESVTQQIYEAIQEAIGYWNQTNDAKQNKIQIKADIEANEQKLVDLDREESEAVISRLEQARTELENAIDLRGGDSAIENYDEKRINDHIANYKGRIANEEAIVSELNNELEREQALLEEIKQKNGENSTAYREQEQVCYDIKNAIAECEKRTLEWGQAITELSLKEFQSQIDGLNNSLDIVESKMEEMDSVIAGAQAYIQDQIDAQEELKKPLEEQIEALQKTNDERERAIALEKAKYDLERAQNQRSVKVFKGEDRGFVYEQDQDAVRDAQDKLSELEFENVIHQLEKQIEYYNDIIENLQEIKDAWGSVKQDAQDAIDIQKAIGEIGVDGILSIDEAKSYTSEYESLLRAQESLNKAIENTTDLYEALKRAIDEYKFGLIDVEECTKKMNEAFDKSYDRYKENEFGEKVSTRQDIQDIIERIKETNDIALTLEDLYGRVLGKVDSFVYDYDYKNLEDTTNNIVDIIEDFYNEVYGIVGEETFNFSNLISDTSIISSLLADIANNNMDSWGWEAMGNKIQDIFVGLKETNPEFQEMATSAEEASKKIDESVETIAEEVQKDMENVYDALQKGKGEIEKLYSELVSDVIKETNEQFDNFVKTLLTKIGDVKTALSSIFEGTGTDDTSVQSVINDYLSKHNTNNNNSNDTPGVEQRAKGGMLTGKDKKLDKLARSLGEDHMTLLAYKEGERVLTPYQNEVWENLVQKASNFKFTPSNIDLFTPKYNNVPISRSAQVSIGDVNVTCSGVTSQQVAQQIGAELKRNFGNMALDALQMSGRR